MTAALLALLAACAAGAGAAEVLAGIDVLQESGFRELKGKRLGLITNQTGLDRKGRSTVQALAEAPGVELRALFAPEHGFVGLSESSAVASGKYNLPDGRAVPLYSLYGSTLAPTAEMLRGLDALVFDIQDIGARFYTYSTTMALALEAAAAAGLDFIVLDRPNPIGGDAVEGAMLDPALRRFIAYLEVPVRHGMTIGELARLHNFRARLGARLQVIALKGWRRELWFDETGLPWTRPSPNMPDLESATLYPGIAGFENTNLSVGRGTPAPFRWLGAPWLDAPKLLARLQAARIPGVAFALETYTPGKSVHAGVAMRGVALRVTDRRALKPLVLFAHLITAVRDLHPKELTVDEDRMAAMEGTRRFCELLASGADAGALIALFEADAARFRAERAAFLLY